MRKILGWFIALMPVWIFLLFVGIIYGWIYFAVIILGTIFGLGCVVLGAYILDY